MKYRFYAAPNGDVFFRWANKKLRWNLTHYDMVCVSTADDGDLLGVVVMTRDAHSMFLDVATARRDWTSRKMINHVFALCFGDLGYRRITALTSAKNMRIHKFVRRLGFRKEGVAKFAFDGRQTEIRFGLLYENWLKNKFYDKNWKEKD
jgi:RimJ/RimL family protein N-acetyltransferase